MNGTVRSTEYLEANIHRELERGKLRALAGTLQRVDYPGRELRVVAQGQVWTFTLAPEAQLWFEDRQAILRCFHPLDVVRIIFAECQPRRVIKAMYAWEKQPARPSSDLGPEHGE
jgi:hypothetical protein